MFPIKVLFKLLTIGPFKFKVAIILLDSLDPSINLKPCLSAGKKIIKYLKLL